MKLYRKARQMVRRQAERSSALIGAALHVSRHWGGLRDIEANNHVVNRAMLKQCREYAADVFGKEVHAFELVTYCSIHGSWREGWVPERYFQSEIVARSTVIPHLSRQKTLSAYFLTGGALPDIGYFCNGRFFASDWGLIPAEHLGDVIFEGRDKIVFKTNSSMGGRGVSVFSRRNFSADVVQRLGNGCFQEYIHPHSTVPTFDVPSVPTLRLVTTVGRAGLPAERFCYLRVGRIGQTHVGSDDSVRILVSTETGKLHSRGYLIDWTPVSVHPDTGIPFEGIAYPRLQDAVAVCTRLHRKMPSFVSIGWDLCLSERGDFKIMEWNQLHGIQFAEATNGPNFADLGWRQTRAS